MSRRLTWLAAVAATLAPMPAAADTVSDWIEFTNRLQNPAAGPDMESPRADVVHANSRVALAMFEALNAIDRKYQPILNVPPVGSEASADAAAATAAYHVLIDHFPHKKSLIEDSYRITMAAIPASPQRTAGEEIGKAAAMAANAAGGIDPACSATPYRPFAKPGQWVPTRLPSVHSGQTIFKPWALPSVEALRPPPPPKLDSAVWARDYQEVKEMGEAKRSKRDPIHTLMARYRQAPDLTVAYRRAADTPGRTLLDNARMFALLSMTQDDAVMAMAEAKLYYDTWRPITAIRNGDIDGNNATELQADWTPLIDTPNFGEHPCGHCVFAGAVAEVMKSEIGNAPVGGVRVGSMLQPNLILQVLPSWDEWAQQVSDSRVYGGVHFRFANEAGEAMGRQAARLVIARYARPLDPE